MLDGRAGAPWRSNALHTRAGVSRLTNGRWLARHAESSTGRVELTASTREEILTKMRDELPYRIEWRPCSGAWGDTVKLLVREQGDSS